METRTLYVVPNWDRDFENSKSKCTENCTFVCIGNHFDGKKIRRLARHEHGQQLHGAFLEIVQVASKCPWRGVLLDADGPIGARDLADKTLFPEEGFTLAFEELCKPFIGLLERHEIECVNGAWVLPETVRHWAIHKSKRRQPAGQRRNAWEPVTDENTPRQSARDRDTSRHQVPPQRHQVSRAATESHEVPPSATDRHEVPRREEKRRELPPTVPQGGRSSVDLVEFDEAKAFLNEIFGREKRKWSFEEDQLLAGLCPLHREDLQPIRQWFRLPLDHQVFEQTKRKQELTTFLRDFNGELDKIRKFAPVFVALNGAAVKKEPSRWREFFEWKYASDGPVLLPATYWQLGQDQRDEWDREHEEFEASLPAEAVAR
jgi:hypothetical protein